MILFAIKGIFYMQSSQYGQSNSPSNRFKEIEYDYTQYLKLQATYDKEAEVRKEECLGGNTLSKKFIFSAQLSVKLNLLSNQLSKINFIKQYQENFSPSGVNKNKHLLIHTANNLLIKNKVQKEGNTVLFQFMSTNGQSIQEGRTELANNGEILDPCEINSEECQHRSVNRALAVILSALLLQEETHIEYKMLDELHKLWLETKKIRNLTDENDQKSEEQYSDIDITTKKIRNLTDENDQKSEEQYSDIDITTKKLVFNVKLDLLLGQLLKIDLIRQHEKNFSVRESTQNKHLFVHIAECLLADKKVQIQNNKIPFEFTSNNGTVKKGEAILTATSQSQIVSDCEINSDGRKKGYIKHRSIYRAAAVILSVLLPQKECIKNEIFDELYTVWLEGYQIQSILNNAGRITSNKNKTDEEYIKDLLLDPLLKEDILKYYNTYSLTGSKNNTYKDLFTHIATHLLIDNKVQKQDNKVLFSFTSADGSIKKGSTELTKDGEIKPHKDKNRSVNFMYTLTNRRAAVILSALSQLQEKVDINTKIFDKFYEIWQETCKPKKSKDQKGLENSKNSVNCAENDKNTFAHSKNQPPKESIPRHVAPNSTSSSTVSLAMKSDKSISSSDTNNHNYPLLREKLHKSSLTQHNLVASSSKTLKRKRKRSSGFVRENSKKIKLQSKFCPLSPNPMLEKHTRRHTNKKSNTCLYCYYIEGFQKKYYDLLTKESHITSDHSSPLSCHSQPPHYNLTTLATSNICNGNGLNYQQPCSTLMPNQQHSNYSTQQQSTYLSDLPNTFLAEANSTQEPQLGEPSI